MNNVYESLGNVKKLLDDDNVDTAVLIEENENYDEVNTVEESKKEIEKKDGSRKIAATLAKLYGIHVSRYIVLKSMKRQELYSKYNNRKNLKPYKVSTDHAEIPNLVNRNFDSFELNEVITSDLTYVPHGKKFYYICFMLDLFNREIVGFSVTDKHDTTAVLEAFDTITFDLSKLKIFHSDRGGEFKGQRFLDTLETMDIRRSLSEAGCPLDNAVSEKLFDIFKFEWMKDSYRDLVELRSDVTEFVNWYNFFRVHGSLEYLTPVEKRLMHSA